MEPLNHQKSIERVVSQRALQMGNSFSCQICVVGFLCGVCLTSLFLAALTSFGTLQFGPIMFSTMSTANSPGDSTSHNNSNMVTRANCNFKLKETERLLDLKSGARERGNDDRVSLLYSAWSAVLKGSTTGGNDENEYYLQKLGKRGSSLPNAPHLENCKDINYHPSSVDQSITI